MGWFFKKEKKVPKVPLPNGRVIDENALRFPTPPHSERVIHPEQVQEAAGVKPELDDSLELPELPDLPEADIPEPPHEAKARPMQQQQMEEMEEPMPEQPQPQMRSMHMSGPLFVKIDVYQRLLGEMDEIKANINQFNRLHEEIDNSEYNEENNFVKLKREIKSVHDRLLQVDERLFNVQGE